MFRDKLAQRGARGILGLQRIFKVMDDNGTGSLDIQEFWKALCDFRLPVSPDECRQLFTLCDHDDSGEIDFDELISKVKGDMNQGRKDIVAKAFKKIDKNADRQ